MSRKHGRIVGVVCYSAGDGAAQRIPAGPCEIDATSQDATISWMDGDSSAVAAIPIDQYTTYLTDGTITVDQEPFRTH